MLSIRRADFTEDRAAMLAMGAAFYATTHHAAHTPFDPVSANAMLDLLQGQGFVLVADYDGFVVGMVGVLVVAFPWNQQFRTAHEVMWYVESDDRASGAGIALERAAEAACRAEGCMELEMLYLESSPAHVARYYRRRGYEPTQHSVAKRLS